MLIPILGRSGFGKTSTIKEKILEIAQSGRKCIVIVPEQFTFETERAMYLSLGDKSSNVMVASFTRLCKKVFETYGGLAGEYITASAKIILINRAIEEISDSLEVYKNSASGVEFVEKALELAEEFKSAGISADELSKSADIAQDESLQKKLSDISKIFEVYTAMLEEKYLDTSDNLLRCLKILQQHSYFRNICVFIDGFTIFSGLQHSIIKLIAEQSDELYITFTADAVADNESFMGTFSPVKQDIARIIANAREVGCKVASPVILSENHRANTQSLEALEEMSAFSEYSEFTDEVKGIEVCDAQNPHSEIENAAVRISKLVKQDKLRYKDIAVLGRSLERYETAIEDIFPKYDIPFFLDRREGIETISIISFVLAVADAIKGRFPTEIMLSIAKSPCMNLDINDVGELENYCYVWGIEKEQWTSEFKNKISGLKYGESTYEAENLEKLNLLRKTITQPIMKLKEKLDGCDGQTFARAIYEFLEDINVKQNLLNFYNCAEDDYEYCLELNNRGYETIMDILDDIALLLKDKIISLNKMFDLFRLCVNSLDLGVIPRTLDGVTVGTADRTKLNNPKAVLIIGANFGVFPAQVSEKGVFSDRERQELRELGLEVTAPSTERKVNELFYAYSALTSASQKLIVSYCTSLADGKVCTPSPIVENLIEAFGEKIIIDRPTFVDKIQNEKTLFRNSFRIKAKEREKLSAVLRCLDDVGKRQRYEEVRKNCERRKYTIEDREVARKLFGGQYTISPSGIERYYQCPFAYFCNYGLRLKTLNKVEFSPMESGTIIHYVLEKIIKKFGSNGLKNKNDSELRQEISKVCEQFVRDYIGSERLVTKRFLYLLRRIEEILLRVLINIREEFRQSKFETSDFEFRISAGGDTPPFSVNIDEENEVIVEGVVDRIDTWQSASGDMYIRVVDYKSGQKVFNLCDVYNGLSLQMLIYLFSLCKKYKQREENIPAGVLYMPTKDSVVNTDRNTPDNQIEKERQKMFKMNGLLLKDYDCIDAMEESIGGSFVPAKLKKDGGFHSASSVLEKNQFAILEEYISHKIKTMGENLLSGNIQAIPQKKDNRLPCEFCNYRSVCKIEDGDETNEYVKLKSSEIIKQMYDEAEEEM